MLVNEKFILGVFKSMIIYKPKLSALLDENDDDFDIRELSNNLTKAFPWPIGIELRRLLSGNMEHLDRGRLDQLLKTIERSMQYLSFVMLIQLLEETINKKLEPDPDFNKEFSRRFETLSMGDFTWLIRSIDGIFRKNQLTPFMEELRDTLKPRFLEKLDFWVPRRNEIGHYLINLTDEEIEVRCNEYIDKLEDILSQLAFLINYPLVTITEIQLSKHKRENVHFLHNMLLLNSSSSSFLAKIQEFEKFTDTHSVILVKNLKNAPNEFLNLSPLIIDTHFEIMESREKLTQLKKDVYLYSKWEKNTQRIHYTGTETIEKPDMRLVSFYDTLVKEFEEVMKTFSLTDPVT
ncbi:MAG: hypothetical protein NTU44_16455 [Bacteroidetes bacterium]|nr:hypothetical protein [Bacteroidota bacterium]